MVSGASSFTTPVGRATKDNDDLFHVGLDGRDVLWISEQAKEMKTRLMVCAHIKDAGHRRIVATLQRLQGYCCLFRMEIHVTEFVKHCLHCIDSKAGEKIQRPLGETVHGMISGEVLHFDYLYANTQYHVMFGRAPLTSFLTLASSTGEYWKVGALDEEALRRKVANVVEAQQRLHKVVVKRVKKNRERQRPAASRGQLPTFAVEDYVMMVARVRKPGSTPNW